MRDDDGASTSSLTHQHQVATTAASIGSLSIDGEKKPFERPPFLPSAPTSSALLDRLTAQPGSSRQTWRVSLSHDVHFSRAGFFSAVKDLALHPERNSSVILRADPLPPRSLARKPGGDSSADQSNQNGVGQAHRQDNIELDEEAQWLGMDRSEEFRLRLMPKQVKRDGKLDQRIAIYQSSHRRDSELRMEHHEDTADPEHRMVLMIPEVKILADIPFYHPPVSKLAFLYESLGGHEHRTDATSGGGVPHDDSADTPPIRGRIHVAYLPFPPSALDNGREQSSKVPPALMPANPLIHPVRRTPPKRRSPLSQSSTEDQAAPPAVVLDPFSSVSTNGQQATLDVSAASSHGVASSSPLTADQNRLDRTLRALLEKVYKYGYNSITPYQKRVHHDILVQKESFQDLYLELKERHRHLESRAPKPGSTKVEDVKRHVWKAVNVSTPSDPSLPLSDISHWGSQDVAVAAFLMLLWNDMYPVIDPVVSSDKAARRWDTWGRPAGGFIDLGCGNGLLVHVLIQEGYAGKGYELRARRTWPLYPPETREALVELPIEFPSWFPNTIEEWENEAWQGKDVCPIKEDCFVIGNHADEITPWIPMLSLIPSRPIPSLSLPCCFHTLDGPFTTLTFTPPLHPHSPLGNFAEGLEEGQSRYKSYIMWLGWYGLMCGWEWEKESLRIPSTKGWAIVARRRWTSTSEELRQCRVWALGLVNGVRQRGAFKIREREGKDH